MPQESLNNSEIPFNDNDEKTMPYVSRDRDGKINGVFDPMDLAAYVAGAVLIVVVELGVRRGR